MRLALIIVLFLVTSSVIAQDGLLPMDHYVTTKAEILMKDSVSQLHSEMRPYSYWDIQKYAPSLDSNYDYERLAFKRKNKVYLRVSPRLAIEGYNQAGSDFKQGIQSIGGLGLGGGIGQWAYFSIDGILGYLNPPTYYGAIMDSLRVYPGFGYTTSGSISNQGKDFSQITGHLALRPSKYVEVRAGRGRNFIGEGYRSVFLGDFTSNYNYLRADVNVWKLRYMILYSQMEQTNDYPNRFYPSTRKYATSHYLSLNLTKWWSVGAFESVVWESEDSVINREFDFNYLNPVIFLRPVEYAMGSSDNSLLGFSSTIRPVSGLTLYGQILLDEFVFSNYTAGIRQRITGDSTIQTGWWGNKQSYQLGVKFHEPFGWKMSSVLAEVNIVRPFTYGHSNRTQSYGHLNQPLAHPLGANFIEWVQITTWQPGKWELALFSTYSRKGYSNNEGFMGEDIQISNTERDENREFGNFLLQGRRVDVGNLRLELGRTIIESWNLKAQATIHYRVERTKQSTSDMVYIGAGLRTALWPNHRNL